jgi:hypothetical protein
VPSTRTGARGLPGEAFFADDGGSFAWRATGTERARSAAKKSRVMAELLVIG